MDAPTPPPSQPRTSAEAGFIPLEDLAPGGIYRIRSRNLTFGVWLPDAMQGTGGFSGIREKFYFRSLFTEYHYDTGGSFGTAHAIEKVGQLPADVELVEHYSGCKTCRQPTSFDMERGETWQDRWQHVDTTLDLDHQAESVSWQNEQIWDVLEAVEAAHARQLRARGELWMGNDIHRFMLMSADEFRDNVDAGREVDAAEYFDAQDAAGVCMGVHHFCSGHTAGRVSQGR